VEESRFIGSEPSLAINERFAKGKNVEEIWAVAPVARAATHVANTQYLVSCSFIAYRAKSGQERRLEQRPSAGRLQL
jgi:hypothetical protein